MTKQQTTPNYASTALNTAINILNSVPKELIVTLAFATLIEKVGAFDSYTGHPTSAMDWLNNPTYPTFEHNEFESYHSCPHAVDFDKATHIKYVTDQIFKCFQETKLIDYCTQNLAPQLGESLQVMSLLLNKLPSGDTVLNSCDTNKCVSTLFLNNITEYTRIAKLLENPSSAESQIQPQETLEQILSLLPLLNEKFQDTTPPLNSLLEVWATIPENTENTCSFSVKYTEHNQKSTSNLISFITGLSVEVVENIIQRTIETITGTGDTQTVPDTAPNNWDIMEIALSGVGYICTSTAQEYAASFSKLLGYDTTADITDFEI